MMVHLSPALDGGGGLKQDRPLAASAWRTALSPALDGGGGLKPVARCRIAQDGSLSPALDGGGGLKHLALALGQPLAAFPPRSMAGAD